METCQSQDGEDSSFIMRRNSLFKLASTLIDEAALSIEATELVIKSFEGLLEQLKELNLSVEQSTSKNFISETTQRTHCLNYIQMKTKGSRKRLMLWRDRKGKTRHCSICRSTKHTKLWCTSVRSKVAEVEGENSISESDDLIDEP